MISLRLILFGIFFLTFTNDVHSVCMQGQVSTQTTKYGTVETQCLFNEIKVLPGSTFRLPAPDCLECTCTSQAMSCCGFGFAAGKVIPPPGCVAYNDACKLIFLKANNLSEICKFEKSPRGNKKKSGKSN